MSDRDLPLPRLVRVYERAVYEAGGRPDLTETDWARIKIRILLNDGIHEDVIAEAIRRMVGRNKLGGWALGTFVNEVLLEARDAPDKALLYEFLDKHDGRWPTGCRFVRGSHSGTYVADPLGYDKAEYGQWRYPRRHEVIAALKEARNVH